MVIYCFENKDSHAHINKRTFSTHKAKTCYMHDNFNVNTLADLDVIMSTCRKHLTVTLFHMIYIYTWHHYIR